MPHIRNSDVRHFFEVQRPRFLFRSSLRPPEFSGAVEMLYAPVIRFHHQTCPVVTVFPGHDSCVVFPSLFAVFFVLSQLIVKVEVVVLPEF